jgi:hypothetical protein
VTERTKVRGIFYNQQMNTTSAVRALKNGPASCRALARSKRTGTTPKDWFSGVGDDAWLWMNTVGRRRFRPLTAIVPGMPDTHIQDNYTGQSEDGTLREGFVAYRLFKQYYETHIGPISDARGVLDFGCGWGRIIRFFLRDVPAGRVSGVDHSAEAIQACRQTNRWNTFGLIDPHPPTALPSSSFHLIYLYSVPARLLSRSTRPTSSNKSTTRNSARCPPMAISGSTATTSVHCGGTEQTDSSSICSSRVIP